ncbi:MAG: hypothetical protein IKE64_13105 [Thermoguttaceae bacterium]|nr:hypothetical protein [Thermoguttaceae bacterium]
MGSVISIPLAVMVFVHSLLGCMSACCCTEAFRVFDFGHGGGLHGCELRAEAAHHHDFPSVRHHGDHFHGVLGHGHRAAAGHRCYCHCALCARELPHDHQGCHCHCLEIEFSHPSVRAVLETLLALVCPAAPVDCSAQNSPAAPLGTGAFALWSGAPVPPGVPPRLFFERFLI